MSNQLFMEIKTENKEMANKLREYILNDFKPNEQYFKDCIDSDNSIVTFKSSLNFLPDFKIFELFALKNNTNLELMFCSDIDRYLKETHGKINNKGEYHSEKVINRIIYAIESSLFKNKDDLKSIIYDIDKMTNDVDYFFTYEDGINKEFFNEIDSVIQNLFDLKTGELKNKNIDKYTFYYKGLKIIFDGVEAFIMFARDEHTIYKKASKYDNTILDKD